ncbi:hypothetical protein NE865_01115 [Phthorimaea operculella]|nr:hypothetical protein NE865_01115 [Phthorimaea operculella]
MSRTFLLFLACLIVSTVSSYIIGNNDIDSKDTPVTVNTDDEFEGDVDDVHKVMGFPLLINKNGDIQRNEDEIENLNKVNEVVGNEAVMQAGADEDKKCAAIGEFCMNHADCCTRSCLGYMKRCVS